MKKYLLLSLLLASQIVSANCNLKSASILENTHKVGPVTNLSKIFDSGKGSCSVSYRIDVDGTEHMVVYRANGPESESALCGYAVERGRRELLLNLGGQFKSQAHVICSDGKPAKRHIQIGDTILENEVGMNTRLNHYWPYKQYSKCRIFKEQYVRNKAPVEYNGVICQQDQNDIWVVVDKW
jgi:hypothetical protein